MVSKSMHKPCCRSGLLCPLGCLAAIRAGGQRSCRLKTLHLLMSVALMASGCALGPDYEAPDAPVLGEFLIQAAIGV